ncbi:MULTISPECIES: hypothetical protein [unclassified Sphingomonas]|uniref:hypothetical protein n=1 Tax=Sphingomonas sp. PvP015 TaxID=3156388 RepID=UPI003399FE2E
MDEEDTQNPIRLRDQLAARLRQAEAELAALHREIEGLRDDLTVTEQFLHVWRRTGGIQGPERPFVMPSVQLRHIGPPAIRKAKNPPRELVVDEVLNIIVNRGRPVPRGELYEELVRQGKILYGKDPVMVLSTMLWRSQDRVVRLPNYGYWLKDRAFDPAGYIPALDDVIGAASREPEDGLIEEDDDDTEVTS